MSYDIYIGNAELEAEWAGEYGPSAEWIVNAHREAAAPFKPDLTENGNSCHPGYSQWANFTREAGLHDVFFANEDGLMCEHPGIKPLTREHLKTFEDAAERFKAQHPNEVAGCCECSQCSLEARIAEHQGKPSPPHDPTLNFNFYRFEWLVWWTRWALENCERPAMYNR